MPLKAKIIIILLSLALFLFVLNLVRKRKLKIEHSILWLVVSAVILTASIWNNLADSVARFLGIDYPPALFLSVAIFFSLAILLHFSIELSKLKDQNKNLTQELAIYKSVVDGMRTKGEEPNEGRPPHKKERIPLG